MNSGASSKKNKKLIDILNQLESDSKLLNDPKSLIKRINKRLQAGADPNVPNEKDGKTLLHYAAENDCLQVIKFLLQKKADPSVKDKSGKTPFKYVTERECRQAIKDLGYDLGDSHENEENPTTPDDSVDDCSNSSGNDSEAKPAELSDCNTEEDLGYGSGDSRENEENPAKSLNNENRTFIDQQTSSESLEVSNSSTKLPLEKGADLNVQTPSDEDSSHSSDDSYENEENATTPDSSVGESNDFVNIICKDEDILSNRDNNISRLNNLAYESIVNKNNKQIHEYDFKAKIKDGHFCIEYPQDSIIEPAKILNHEKAKELNLKAGILKIGESKVRVESIDGKRNYTDILGSIEMSFTTEAGEISIYLHPSEKDSNKIEVEIDKESEARLNKLKAEKKSLGENCLLGRKSVLEAIEDKGFEKNGSVFTESTETTKDDPFTNLTQVDLRREKENTSRRHKSFS